MKEFQFLNCLCGPAKLTFNSMYMTILLESPELDTLISAERNLLNLLAFPIGAQDAVALCHRSTFLAHGHLAVHKGR